eukprot:m.99802 g.99802  ORF g.99802 m.99802 type:complete len:143 (+) comp12471_c0_seq3:119-547(+)
MQKRSAPVVCGCLERSMQERDSFRLHELPSALLTPVVKRQRRGQAERNEWKAPRDCFAPLEVHLALGNVKSLFRALHSNVRKRQGQPGDYGKGIHHRHPNRFERVRGTTPIDGAPRLMPAPRKNIVSFIRIQRDSVDPTVHY